MSSYIYLTTPDTPTGIKFNPGENSVDVNWDPILGVQYKISIITGANCIDYITYEPFLHVDNLTPNTEYTFNIKACTSNYCSGESVQKFKTLVHYTCENCLSDIHCKDCKFNTCYDGACINCDSLHVKECNEKQLACVHNECVKCTRIEDCSNGLYCSDEGKCVTDLQTEVF